MKLPCCIRGFTLEASYLSRSTGRTCSTAQCVMVSHPRYGALERLYEGRSFNHDPVGIHASWGAARSVIEQQYQHAHNPLHALTLMTHQPSYVARLALWWPDAPNPPLALAQRAKQDAKNARVEQRLVEVDAKQRLIEAAPDMLAALKVALSWLEICHSDTPEYAQIDAAITKAEKG